MSGEKLFCTPSLELFLCNRITRSAFKRPEVLEAFANLDDYDIMSAIKVWATHKDPILAELCASMVNRQLYAVELQNKPFDGAYVEKLYKKAEKKLKLKPVKDEMSYFVFTGAVQNNAYSSDNIRINIKFKNGQVMDISEAADIFNISVLSKPVKKYFLCYPKSLREQK
jgi:hypothetical protein